MSPYSCNGYRLPTEAEWEYAARAGTTHDFWSPDEGGSISNSNGCTGEEYIMDNAGEMKFADYAWYCGNANNNSTGTGLYGAKEVGQKLPDNFGLYDMQGNVNEWVSDWTGCSFPNVEIDPYCDVTNHLRVQRSGYWGTNSNLLKISARNTGEPGGHYSSSGFRLVRFE